MEHTLNKSFFIILPNLTYFFWEKNFQLLQNLISEHTALSVVVYLKFPGSVEFYRGADPSHDAKFAKLKSQKGQVFVNDEKLIRFSRTLSRRVAMCLTNLAFQRRTSVADYLSNRLT